LAIHTTASGSVYEYHYGWVRSAKYCFRGDFGMRD
jgi:hypothetical protein